MGMYCGYFVNFILIQWLCWWKKASYLSDKDKYITVTFCEQSGDKLVTKGTYAKMARGEMVRYMAEKEIENPADVQTFDRLGYNFRRDLSSEIEYVFERKIME